MHQPLYGGKKKKGDHVKDWRSLRGGKKKKKKNYKASTFT